MKLKSLYLVLLMLCMSTAIFAQEKYEQGVVQQGGVVLFITLEGKPTERVKLKLSEADDYSILLKKVAELREQVWEVFNTAAMASGYCYFIRRKIK